MWGPRASHHLNHSPSLSLAIWSWVGCDFGSCFGGFMVIWCPMGATSPNPSPYLFVFVYYFSCWLGVGVFGCVLEQKRRLPSKNSYCWFVWCLGSRLTGNPGRKQHSKTRMRRTTNMKNTRKKKGVGGNLPPEFKTERTSKQENNSQNPSLFSIVLLALSIIALCVSWSSHINISENIHRQNLTKTGRS